MSSRCWWATALPIPQWVIRVELILIDCCITNVIVTNPGRIGNIIITAWTLSAFSKYPDVLSLVTSVGKN